MEHRVMRSLLTVCSILCHPLNSDASGQCSDAFHVGNGIDQSQPYICPKRECTNSAHEVWGTGSYTYDSSICVTAWHDGRILPWSDNDEDRTVTWTPSFDLDMYYRTRRYGFTTEGYGRCPGRNFTSARVNEPLYNINVLVSLSDGDVRVYGGSNVHIGTDAIESGVHVDIGSSGAALAPVPNGNVGMGPNAYSRYTIEDKFAAYYFTLNKKNLYSWVIVPGVTFSTGDCKEDERGYTYRGRINTTRGGITCQRWDSQSPHTHHVTGERFIENYCRNTEPSAETGPWCYTSSSSRRWDYCNVQVCTQDHITQRASIGAANVKFNYKGSQSGLKWRKDGGSFTGSSSIWDGQQTPTINTVELGHGGIYMVYTEQGNTRTAKGVFRLIVRVCPDGKYGGLCEHNCPTCSNGGVCHDITGECICAPGFKGRHCSEACGPNKFGYDCASQCSDDEDTGCRYRQVCIIDPYGCSCATGFKGIGCDQECPDNSYGADCLQSCGHCLSGPCDKFRGNCTCQEGYKMPYCKTEFARFAHSPSISRSSTGITVSWRPWSTETDYGVGPVHKYIVEYRQATASEWTQSVEIDKAVSSFSIPSTDVQNQYQIRIRIKVDINDVGNPSSEASACGLPRLSIERLTLESNAIRVNWNVPDWRCDKVGTYTLFYKNSSNSDSASEANIPSSTVERVFPTLACTEWTFKIQAHNKDLNSDVSQEMSVTTPEKQAKKVKALLSSSITHDTISLTWEAPVNNGCPVKSYIIQYKLTEVLACDTANQPSEDSKADNTIELATSLDNLRPYSRYDISVRARTDTLDGEDETITMVTHQYLPCESPTSVKIVERSNNTLKFNWERPSCLSSNGPTNNFDYQLQSQASPCRSNEFVNNSTNGLSKTFDHLQPHVTYSFRVRAVNGELAGPWSNWTRNVTNASAPPPPKNLSVVDMNPTFVIIGWIPPCPPNGVIRKYQLNYKSLNDIDDNNITSCTDCSSLKLFNLKIKSTYQFKIRAKNIHWGSWSSSIYETFKEGVPQKPDSVVCKERNQHTVTVHWVEPSRKNGFLTQYKISWNTINERLLSVTVGPSILSFEVQELKPGTPYNVQVAARTSVGFGPQATTICWTALPDIVDLALHVITKDDMTDTTVKIHLTPANDYSKSVYIKYYLIVVDTLRKISKQRRTAVVDASSLKGYEEAQRNQEPRYIAANLTAGFVGDGVDFVVGDGEFYGGYMNAELHSGYLYKFLYGVFIERGAENKSHFQVFDVQGAYNGQFVEVRDYSTSSLGLTVSTTCGSLAFVIVLGVVVFVLYRKRRTMQDNGGMAENINEPGHSKETPRSGQTALELSTVDDVYAKSCTNNAFQTYEATYHNRPTSNVYEKIEPNYWMIPFTSISFGDVIGKGSFGDVQSATVVNNTSTIKVALKRLNASATDKDRLDFIGELNILSEVGIHPNIVSLIGACEHQGVLLVATEYAANGNLRKFLRNSRMDSDYANVGSTTCLTEKQLLQMALDVSRGMKHLAGSKIIHRDIAARNVLVTDDLTAKISDFGLSRNEEIYVKHTQTRVPIRWMAPESIFDHSYTTKSDVWSFGILMWEIVTLGGTPYSGVSSCHLQAMLQSGYRMPQPCNCSEDVYDLMTMCWREVPHKRPSFNVLAPMLEDMLTQRKTFISVKCGDDFIYETIDTGKDDC